MLSRNKSLYPLVGLQGHDWRALNMWPISKIRLNFRHISIYIYRYVCVYMYIYLYGFVHFLFIGKLIVILDPNLWWDVLGGFNSYRGVPFSWRQNCHLVQKFIYPRQQVHPIFGLVRHIMEYLQWNAGKSIALRFDLKIDLIWTPHLKIPPGGKKLHKWVVLFYACGEGANSCLWLTVTNLHKTIKGNCTNSST